MTQNLARGGVAQPLPFQTPTRLADGLGLESALSFRYEECAPIIGSPVPAQYAGFGCNFVFSILKLYPGCITLSNKSGLEEVAGGGPEPMFCVNLLQQTGCDKIKPAYTLL